MFRYEYNPHTHFIQPTSQCPIQSFSLLSSTNSPIHTYPLHLKDLQGRLYVKIRIHGKPSRITYTHHRGIITLRHLINRIIQLQPLTRAKPLHVSRPPYHTIITIRRRLPTLFFHGSKSVPPIFPPIQPTRYTLLTTSLTTRQHNNIIHNANLLPPINTTSFQPHLTMFDHFRYILHTCHHVCPIV